MRMRRSSRRSVEDDQAPSPLRTVVSMDGEDFVDVALFTEPSPVSTSSLSAQRTSPPSPSWTHSLTACHADGFLMGSAEEEIEVTGCMAPTPHLSALFPSLFALDTTQDTAVSSDDDDDSIDLELASRLNMSDMALLDGGRCSSPGALRLTKDGLDRHTQRTSSFQADSPPPLFPAHGYSVWKKNQEFKQKREAKKQQTTAVDQERALSPNVSQERALSPVSSQGSSIKKSRSFFRRSSSKKNQEQSIQQPQLEQPQREEKDDELLEHRRIEKMRSDELLRQRQRESLQPEEQPPRRTLLSSSSKSSSSKSLGSPPVSRRTSLRQSSSPHKSRRVSWSSSIDDISSPEQDKPKFWKTWSSKKNRNKVVVSIEEKSTASKCVIEVQDRASARRSKPVDRRSKSVDRRSSCDRREPVDNNTPPPIQYKKSLSAEYREKLRQEMSREKKLKRQKQQRSNRQRWQPQLPIYVEEDDIEVLHEPVTI